MPKPKSRGGLNLPKEKKLPNGKATAVESIKALYRKILMMQETERARLSRDLHDETGQMVIALGTYLNVLEKELKAGNIEKTLQIIGEKRKLIQEIAQKMRIMALNLRPPALDVLGLSAVLREYFSQCTKGAPFKIEFNENIKDLKLHDNIEITLYRIVQEAISNVLKHASAKRVKLDITRTRDNIEVYISDDGVGFNVEEYETNFDIAKMGLRGIKERVDILNGEFLIKSSEGQGTSIKVALPIAVS